MKTARERRICRNARAALRMMRHTGRMHASPSVPPQMQEPGFQNWLLQRLRQTGEFVGDVAIWIGENAVRAWNLYQVYRNMTGQPTLPVPTGQVPPLSPAPALPMVSGFQATMPIRPPAPMPYVPPIAPPVSSETPETPEPPRRRTTGTVGSRRTGGTVGTGGNGGLRVLNGGSTNGRARLEEVHLQRM